MKSTRNILLPLLVLFLFCSLIPGHAHAEASLSISGMELGKVNENGFFPVTKIYKGSPAHRAGIMAGDLIAEVDHADISVMEAQEVDRTLSSRLGAGESSVLTVLTPHGKNLAWLRPLKLTLEQQNAMDFYQVLNMYSQVADSHWKDLVELFQECVTGRIGMMEAESDFATLGQALNQSRLDITGISLPSGVPADVLAICSDLKHQYIATQMSRFAAKGKMLDYAQARWGDASFLDSRWEKALKAKAEAEEEKRKAGFYSNRLLRYLEYPGEDMVTLMEGQ